MNDLVGNLAVVPVLVGPLQVLLALLPAIAISVFSVLVSITRPRVVWGILKLIWRFKLQLAVVALVAWGVIWGWPRLFPSAPGAAVAEAGVDWPLFRGDPARTGSIPGGGDPRWEGRVWSFDGAPGAIYSSPAVVGNRVYFSSASPAILGDGEGRLVCLDADTGGLVWESRPDGYAATFSSPVVVGDRLVCGEGLHLTRNARIVCLSLAAGEEGKVLWTFATNSHVECAPVVADGRVIIGAGDDGYYCLELEPDAEGNARVVWHLAGEQYPDAETSLAVHEGRVYAGLGVGGMAFCVIDAATGEELHRMPTGQPVFSPPAIAGDAIWFGSGFGDYIHAAETLDPPRSPAGTVWCLGLADLAVRWKTELPRTVLGAVAVKDGKCYAACRDGTLYQLDAATGAITGRAACHAPLLASPAVGETTVYVVTEGGTLFGYATAGLERVWKCQLGTGTAFLSSPAVARGHVYVGTTADGLVCAGRPGAPRALLWTGVPRVGDDTALPAVGSLQWYHPLEQDGSAQTSVITAMPAVVGDHLLVPVELPSSKEVQAPDRCGLADLNPTVAQDTERLRWFVRTGRIRRPPLALGSPQGDLDRVFVVGDERLHAFDASGRELWSRPVAEGASGALALDREGLWGQVDAGKLARFTLDGGKLWSADCPRLLQAPVLHRGLLVLVTREDDGEGLRLVDAMDGTPLWSIALPCGTTTAPVVVDRAVLVSTGCRLELRDITDGGVTWHCDGTVVGRPLVDGTRVWWADAGGAVHACDLASGVELAVAPLGLDGGGFLKVRDRLLATDDGNLVTLTLLDGVIVKHPWSVDDWLGAATTPPIAAGGRVFVARPGWGLSCLGAE